MEIVGVLLGYALAAAVGLGLLYLVIRSAVGDALRRHAAELAASKSAGGAPTGPPPAHMDADGL